MSLPQAFGTLFEGYLNGRQHALDQQSKLKAEERAALNNRASLLVKMMQEYPATEYKEVLGKSLVETLDAIDSDGKRSAKQKPNGLGSMFRGFFGIQPKEQASHPLQSIAEVMKEAERQRQAHAAATGAMGSVAGSGQGRGGPPVRPQVRGTPEGPSPTDPGQGDFLGRAVEEPAPPRAVMTPQHVRLGDAEYQATPVVTSPALRAYSGASPDARGDAMAQQSPHPEDTSPDLADYYAGRSMSVPPLSAAPDMGGLARPSGMERDDASLPQRSPIVENYLQKARPSFGIPRSAPRPQPMGGHSHADSEAEIIRRNTGYGGFRDEEAIKRGMAALQGQHKAESDIYGDELDEWMGSVIQRTGQFVSGLPGDQRSFTRLMSEHPQFAQVMTELQAVDPKVFESFRTSGLFSDYQGQGFQKPDPMGALDQQIVDEGRDAGKTGIQIRQEREAAGAPLDQQWKARVVNDYVKNGLSPDQANLKWEASKNVRDAAALALAQAKGIPLHQAVAEMESASRAKPMSEVVFDAYMAKNGGNAIAAYREYKAADDTPEDATKRRKNQLLEGLVKQYGETPAGISRALREVDAIGDRPDLQRVVAVDPETKMSVFAFINPLNPGRPIYTKVLSPDQPNLDQWTETVQVLDGERDETGKIRPGLGVLVPRKQYSAAKIIDGLKKQTLRRDQAETMATTLRDADPNSAAARQIFDFIDNPASTIDRP